MSTEKRHLDQIILLALWLLLNHLRRIPLPFSRYLDHPGRHEEGAAIDVRGDHCRNRTPTGDPWR
jgi:hypothetical protein